MRSTLAVVLFLATAAPAASQSDRPTKVIATRSVVHHAAFAPDGRSIVGWSSEGFSRWDVTSGKEIERQPVFLKHCGRRSAALPRSEGGMTVAVNCGGKLLFFDIATTAEIGEWKFDAKQTPVVYTASAAASLVAKVVAGATTVVELVDLKSGEARGTFENTQEVQQMSFAPDGRTLATGAVDGVRLWQLPEGKLLHTVPNGTFHAFGPNGQTIAVERGRDVAVVEVASGAVKQQLTATATQLRFSGDGQLLAAWNNQHLTVWDVSAGKPLLNLKAAQLVTVTMSPDSVNLAAVGMDLAGNAARTTLALWRLRP